MTIYTGVADVNGDFNIPFSSNYTGGEKITVTSEKDNATKSIVLYAPSGTTGGGVIDFSGNLAGFPNNIGTVLLGVDVVGALGSYAFAAYNNLGNLWRKATGLKINGAVTSIGEYCFYDWRFATSLELPAGLLSIGSNAFNNWMALTELNIPTSVTTLGAYSFANLQACKSIGSFLPATISPNCFSNWTGFDSVLSIPNGVVSIGSNSFTGWSKATGLVLPNSVVDVQSSAFASWSLAERLTIGSGITTIASSAFSGWTACNEIICHAAIPPSIQTNTFYGLKSTCIFKVPAASVAAYQAAPNWSTFAARIQAI